MECAAQYPSDLTNRQWQIIRRLLPPRSRRGRPRIDRRRIINAIMYVVRSGCQWRMLPSDFPKWKTVYGIFWTWRNDGTWQRIHTALRQKVRRAAGKKTTPTAAILDSQSIRTAEGGEERGYDAGEKGHRPETSPGRRYARDGADGGGSKCLLAGPRWGLLCAGATAGTVPTDQSSFRRQRLQTQRAAGVGPRNIWLGAANGTPSGRSERLRRAAEALDCGTDLRVAHAVSPPQP